MKKIIFLFLILIATAKIHSQTIYSTPQGGFWNDSTTWVDYQIPTAVNDVVLNGTVYLGYFGPKDCRNILVNMGFSLSNDSSPGGSTGWYLNVSGNFTNYGVVTQGNQGLSIYINGNLTNYGNWKVERTYMSAGLSHIYFTDSAFCQTNIWGSSNTDLVIDSDLKFPGVREIHLEGGQLNLYPQFKIGPAYIMNGRIACGNTFRANGEITLAATEILGGCTLKGLFKVNSGVVFDGNVTIQDSVIDGTGGGHTVSFYGDLVNSGYLKLLNKYIKGDLINDGIWEDGITVLQSEGDQEIRIVNNNSVTGIIDIYAGYNGLEYFWYKDGVYYSQGNYIRFQNPDSTKYGVYVCKTVIAPGDTAMRTITFHKGTIINVEENNSAVTGYELFQNYPNPFNPSTKIRFRILNLELVTLKVYNILGSEAATMINDKLPAGEYEVVFNPESGNSNPVSGIYFYKLRAGNFVQTKKMIYLK